MVEQPARAEVGDDAAAAHAHHGERALAGGTQPLGDDLLDIERPAEDQPGDDRHRLGGRVRQLMMVHDNDVRAGRLQLSDSIRDKSEARFPEIVLGSEMVPQKPMRDVCVLGDVPQ